MSKLEYKFHQEMINVYKAAKKDCNYNATRFLQMIGEKGGVATAKQLLNTSGMQSGYTELWMCGCIDIAMEALDIQEEFALLFTEEEVASARQRLKECGYEG